MLVITEIGEAVEALRCGNIFDDRIRSSDEYFEFMNNIDDEEDFKIEFEESIKDTFEDEIADVFIRLFDLCGYLGIEIDKILNMTIDYDTMRFLKDITFDILCIEENLDSSWKNEYMTDIFIKLLAFCKAKNIDIEKNITAKMQYNKTRPKKHGKEF